MTHPTIRLARGAGLAYLVLMLTSALGLLGAPVVKGSAASVAAMVQSSPLRFRIGIASDLIAQVCGIVLVLLLYRLLSVVDKNKAALMVTLLLVSVPISFVITLFDVAAQILLGGEMQPSSLTENQLSDLARLFLELHTRGVFALEVFWGLWLLPFGLLVIKSRMLPRVLGALLLVAGVCYVAQSITALLVGVHATASLRPIVLVAGAAGEIATMLWLLIRGAAPRGAVAR